LSKPSNMSNLPTPLQQILPSAYEYQVDNYNELEPKVTSENAGHSAATARHVYEDELHLSASSREEIVRLLADRSKIWMREVVDLYNISDNRKAVLQVYNSLKSTPFILTISL
ncbi:23333_t:CDS:2, partial [Racocetra persica]